VTERRPTGGGQALVTQVGEIVRQGERAQDEQEEARAASALDAVIADTLARGEEALPDVLRLADPALPPGVQEVGVRLLGRLGTTPALEALAAIARGQAAVPVKLLALRGLRGSSLPFARGALVDVAQDLKADLEVRAYALDLMRDLEGAESILYDVALDASDDPMVRRTALDALLDLSPARGREARAEVERDPKMAEVLGDLRDR
jgi:hypothetical protein